MKPSESVLLNSRRRGMAVAVVVVVMTVLALAVVSAVEPLPQEHDTTALRVETLRAFYAAESGALVTMSTMNAGAPVAAEGSSIELPSARFAMTTVPPATGELVITGSSGGAARTVRLMLE